MTEDPGTAHEQGFLSYHEPSIVQILVLISFFFFLSLGEWLSDKVFRAGLIGQIVVGIIYGVPLADILGMKLQETFVALGYVGLILIIFEGALAVRIDLLRSNFVISSFAAAIGIIAPIGLSYLLCYVGFSYGAVETFIVGAALSATSLGTTFVVIKSASIGINFVDTRVGTVLVSAAVFDDVCGLVMASVINSLGRSDNSSANLGWIIGRPIVAAAAMGILTPLFGKWVLGPIFRRSLEAYFPRLKHIANIWFMTFVLSSFIAIAAYAGTSVLYGAFLAGVLINYLPSTKENGVFAVRSREEGERTDGKCPTFQHTFDKYILDVMAYVFQPLFFASVGFAIPFTSLWTGTAIWRGICYSTLMFIGKLGVGFSLPVCDFLLQRKSGMVRDQLRAGIWPASMLGLAMCARGEIGLLIVQIGLNNTDYLSEDAFISAVWAILLNTIVGPVAVGFLLKSQAKEIGHGPWGLQKILPTTEDVSAESIQHTSALQQENPPTMEANDEGSTRSQAAPTRKDES